MNKVRLGIFIGIFKQRTKSALNTNGARIELINLQSTREIESEGPAVGSVSYNLLKLCA